MDDELIVPAMLVHHEADQAVYQYRNSLLRQVRALRVDFPLGSYEEAIDEVIALIVGKDDLDG